MAITLREGLGRKLTIAEMDENFLFLSSSYVVNSITGSMTASFADSATSASIADEISQLATASFADSATTASHAITASYAVSASVEITKELSSSFADTASHALDISDGVVTNDKLANSSLTVGSTEIALGATSTTLSGLTDVVGTKFSGSFSGSFDGDGSALTGISSYTVANSADNRVLTSVDASNGNAEANLTFDGTALDVTGNVTASAGFSGSLYEGTDVNTTSGSIGDLTVTRITETSALEYKTDVRAMRTSDKIYQLRPVNFKWKEDQRKDVGLIAEEVIKIYPELVKTDGEGNAMGVNYSKLTAVLIKTVQDLKARIEILENK